MRTSLATDMCCLRTVYWFAVGMPFLFLLSMVIGCLGRFARLIDYCDSYVRFLGAKSEGLMGARRFIWELSGFVYL